MPSRGSPGAHLRSRPPCGDGRSLRGRTGRRLVTGGPAGTGLGARRRCSRPVCPWVPSPWMATATGPPGWCSACGEFGVEYEPARLVELREVGQCAPTHEKVARAIHLGIALRRCGQSLGWSSDAMSVATSFMGSASPLSPGCRGAAVCLRTRCRRTWSSRSRASGSCCHAKISPALFRLCPGAAWTVKLLSLPGAPHDAARPRVDVIRRPCVACVDQQVSAVSRCTALMWDQSHGVLGEAEAAVRSGRRAHDVAVPLGRTLPC